MGKILIPRDGPVHPDLDFSFRNQNFHLKFRMVLLKTRTFPIRAALDLAILQKSGTLLEFSDFTEIQEILDWTYWTSELYLKL